MRRTAVALMMLGMVAALPAFGQTTPAPARPAAGAHPPAAAPAPQTLAAGQFPTETAAKAHCPTDSVVWVNLGGSKAYHTSADRYYGKTRRGAYMCQKEAEQAGFHAPGARTGKAAAKTPATTQTK